MHVYVLFKNILYSQKGSNYCFFERKSFGIVMVSFVGLVKTLTYI